MGNALPAGANVSIVGSFVVYTAPTPTAGHGSFEYTLSDGPGGHTVTGLVTVTETPTPGPGNANSVSIVASGADFLVTFIGVPGGSYRVQYTTSTSAPYVWQEFSPPGNAPHVAAPNGVFQHLDVAPPDPLRLYRAIPHP